MAETTVRDEFAAEEIARLTLENSRLMAGPDRGRKPDTSGLTTVREMSGGSASLSADIVDGARRELAAHLGLDASDMDAAVLALTGGEKDQDSQAHAILELSGMRPREVQELLLSDDVSAEDRRALAKRGLALEDGSYPVHDRRHLHSAAVLAASGHGDVAAARKLIRKRAAELGIDISSLPGFEGGAEPETRVKKKTRRAAHYGEAGQRGQHWQAPGGGDADGGGDGPGGGEGAAMTGRRVLARDSSGRLMTLQLTGDGDEDVELAAPDVYDEFFGPKAAEVRTQVSRAEEAEDDDPSVDHEAEVERFTHMAADGGFVVGKTRGLAGSGYRNPSKAYGANVPGRLAGRYPGTGPTGRPQR